MYYNAHLQAQTQARSRTTETGARKKKHFFYKVEKKHYQRAIISSFSISLCVFSVILVCFLLRAKKKRLKIQTNFILFVSDC